MTTTDALAKTMTRLLTAAHRRMDVLGYPAAGPRPDDRHFCSACGRWSEAPRDEHGSVAS